MAHSYGGVVASQSLKGWTVKERRAAGRSGGVLGVIYVAALVLEEGQRIMDVLSFGSNEREKGVRILGCRH